MGGALAGIGAGAVRSFSGDYLLAFMTSGLACLLVLLLVLRIRGLACDSARGLTGRERDLTFRGPGTEFESCSLQRRVNNDPRGCWK